MKNDLIGVGDRIKISVELIQDISLLPGARTRIVRVSDIQVQDDGSKILVLENVRP